MTLQQIRYVAEIARHGTISKAAQELYITQPHLSSVLKELENELGITIFSRARKGVVLTEDGREFLHFARPLLEQEERILNFYADKPSSAAPFRFSISTQRYPFVIKAFYSYFQKLAPEQFEIHLRESSMDAVIRDVFEKRSDLGIIFLSASTEKFIRKYLAARNLEFHEMVAIDPCVFFRKDHPMAARAEVDLDDMEAYPFASFESGVSVSVEFSEEVLFSSLNAFTKRIYVVDRGTMINTLTHTDAFPIGTGILCGQHQLAGIFKLAVIQDSVESNEYSCSVAAGMAAKRPDVFNTVSGCLPCTEPWACHIYGIGTAVYRRNADVYISGGSKKFQIPGLAISHLSVTFKGSHLLLCSCSVFCVVGNLLVVSASLCIVAELLGENRYGIVHVRNVAGIRRKGDVALDVFEGLVILAELH